MFVVNNQYPGPLIEANQGDTIIVNVKNDLDTGAGIRAFWDYIPSRSKAHHPWFLDFHGTSQVDTAWSDGYVLLHCSKASLFDGPIFQNSGNYAVPNSLWWIIHL
jgi:FtsP/CotA-like multicopper oxidase with cupredoxin domain